MKGCKYLTVSFQFCMVQMISCVDFAMVSFIEACAILKGCSQGL